MRFLADENFPGAAVISLREAGHDVASIAADAPSSPDRDVLARASTDGRVLLTFDKDFGELAFRAHLPADCGVILFRLVGGLDVQLKLVVLALRERHRDELVVGAAHVDRRRTGDRDGRGQNSKG